MEKLNLEKFEPLSAEALNQLEGGWGWEVIEAKEYHYLGKDRTYVMMHRKKLFGGYKYKTNDDIC
ncbi:MAG: ComC/BlpC family leader-containing pheromone/bacteriocin [bacterium]